MQSTTILMHAIGLAVLGCDRLRKVTSPGVKWLEYANDNVDTFIQYMEKTDFGVIAKWI